MITTNGRAGQTAYAVTTAGAAARATIQVRGGGGSRDVLEPCSCWDRDRSITEEERQPNLGDCTYWSIGDDPSRPPIDTANGTMAGWNIHTSTTMGMLGTWAGHAGTSRPAAGRQQAGRQTSPRPPAAAERGTTPDQTTAVVGRQAVQ